MALILNGSSQYLAGAIAGLARSPVTIMAWVKETAASYNPFGSVIDTSSEDNAESIQGNFGEPRIITWSTPNASVAGAATSGNVYHCFLGIFGASQLTLRIDGTETSGAYTPSAYTGSRIEIGRAGSVYSELLTGAISHFAIWDCELTSTERGQLVNKSVNPLAVSSDHLIAYLPFDSSLADEVDNVTWTAYNLASPTYEDSGIDYPPVGRVIYQQNDTFAMGTGNVVLYVVWSGSGNITGTAATLQEVQLTTGSGTVVEPAVTGTVTGTQAKQTSAGTGTVPASHYHVIYYGNGNDGGDVPVDGTEYAPGSTATVLDNTGGIDKDWVHMGWVEDHGIADMEVDDVAI